MVSSQMFLPRDQKCLSQLGEMLKATPWCTLGLCPTSACKVLPLWHGKIHPKDAPLQQVKNGLASLRINLDLPSEVLQAREKVDKMCILLLPLFLGMLQQRLWSRPTSDPGRRMLGGPQGKRLSHGRAAGVPHPC